MLNKIKAIIQWLINKWGSFIFRIEIYSVSIILFLFISERKIFDSFVYSLFIEILRPMIINVATDGRLTTYIVEAIIGLLSRHVIKAYINKNNKKK